jgi:ribosomal protein S18 acetylase RimI-like enzyme
MNQGRDIIVRDLRPGDEDIVVDVLTDAFIDFPPVQIVIGTGSGAKDRLRRLNRATVSGARSSRFLIADRDGDVLGVLQCADQPDCFKMGGRQMLSLVRILGPRLVAAMRMFREVGKIHPKTPHRHLSQVAVRPAAQRQGVGAALMAAYCDSCDEDGLRGYLETIAWADPTRPSQRKLYERYGFVVEHESPGGDGWTGLTMTRAAGDPSSTT